ncbi:hypothetical protein [Jannaschia sp. 2305UL9-9]|uniref:hypothetical protein n=1 Tax=Jannaschia sp. 2305UL9-9 TaxID=3121638 RepID=UPI003529B5CC
MAQWLGRHGLTAGTCAALLRATVPPTVLPPLRAGNAPVIPDGPAIWACLPDALAGQLPMLRAEIARTARQTTVVFDPGGTRHPVALTLVDVPPAGGGQGGPLVVCPTDGTVTDVLALAHEFGHALNHVAAGAQPIQPPMTREVCAFACEALILRGLPTPLSDAAQALRLRHGARYLGAGRRRLLTALTTPGAPYDYGWNYPLAWGLARALIRPAALPLLADLLAARVTLAGVVDALPPDAMPQDG